MAALTVTRSIDASAGTVFQVVSDPRRFAQAISGVTNLEILSEATAGAGTRFRQSRTLNGKATTMDFEITESIPNKRVRILNETQGTTWDSIFDIAPAGPSTNLTMRMEARPSRLLPRLLMPLIFLIIENAVARDLDGVKVACERP